ncbi:MAG: PilZ domain-containing protein [Candidatus Hydrogenedentota bacterium]
MAGENEAEGVVRDISRGGCSVELPENSEIERDAELEVSFDLPDGARVEAIRSFVRSIRAEHRVVVVGCCFSEAIDKNTAADIEFFVTSTLERFRASPPSTQRILVLAPKHRADESSIAALDNLGFEFQVAHDPVDAFFQLRLNRPAAFVASAEGVLPGAEVCRLVRENRALTNLPIVVFRDGEPPDETENKAVMEAGATRYVSGANAGKQLAEALEDVLAAFAR